MILGLHQPQPEIGRHLVVAAAAGMQLAGRLADEFAQPPLDRGMDILVGRGECERFRSQFFSDLRQAGAEFRELIGRQQSGALERMSPGDRAADVLGGQAAVDGQRRVQCIRHCVQSAFQPSGP